MGLSLSANTFLLCEVNQCEPGTTEALGIHTMALTRISNSGTWCSTLSKTQRPHSVINLSDFTSCYQLLPDVTRCYCFNFRPGNSCNAHDPQQAHQPDHAGVVRPATESTEHTTSNGHPGVDRNNAPILAFRHPLCPPWFIFGEVSEPNFTAPDNMDNQIKFLQKLRSPNFLEFLLRFRNLRL